MAQIRLPTHVSFGVVDDRPVFLDLSRDRYLALDGGSADAFELLRNSSARLSPQDEASLLATGLFEPGEPCHPPLPVAPPPLEAQVELSPGRTGIADGLAVWRLLRRVDRELRDTPLIRILARRSASPSRRGDMDAEQVASLARRFLRARGSAPVKPRCLPDSLALWDWLRAKGAPSSIIFGVKLDPFAAHCWVQHGGLALNEAVDRAGEYSPVCVFP